MSATITEQDVFTFDQLSDSAKDYAREEMRELEGRDFDTEFLMNDFEWAADILGISDLDVSWSGFWSQGDGASFTGRYNHIANSPQKIREEYGEASELYAIADGLAALQIGYRLLKGSFVTAVIGRHSTSYSHEMTMDCTAYEDSETEDELDWDSNTSKRILELMRDFARWIYKSLEQEWDYRISDENIDELLADDEFDENGDRL